MKGEKDTISLDMKSILSDVDHFYMGEALKEARLALEEGEVPIGAVVVSGDEIIGRGHNSTEGLSDITAHAEMIAITSAQNSLGSKVLPECTIYVTVEPCVMCAGAIRWSRFKRLVWGCDEPKVGFTSVASTKVLHPKTEITPGVRGDEASDLMQRFFRPKRK